MRTSLLTGLILLSALGCGGDPSADVSADDPALSVRVSAQKAMMDGPNVYSPELVKAPTGLRMYFGGWRDAGQRHDNIYVSDCPDVERACGNVRKVLDSQALGFEHLNDPSIVIHPGGYYIMYMTAVRAGDNALVAANNHVYYATSWITDGVTWSAPALLVSRHWLPSATIKGEAVELYANDNAVHGGVVRFELGRSGVQVGAPTKVTPPNGTLYANVHALWRPSLDSYQILAERQTATASSVIDALSSTDGLAWNLIHDSLVTPAAGEFRVGTPAPHPDTNARIYFATTKSRSSTGFAIRTLSY
ncbi:hypothetical protein BH11MYX4_BH11MYX4_38710 [soil metagenome]